MAQTGFTPILLYASNTATSVPSAGNLTNSANGAEVAVNTADKRLFTKDSGGAVVELGTNPSALSVAGNVTLSGGTANGVLYLNGSKVATSGTALAFNGTTLSVTGNVSSSNAGNENYFLSDGSTRSSLQQSSNAFYYNVNDNSATSGAFIWRNTNAFSELMRLTSTGLGIGTSSPANKLHVTVSAASTAAAAIYNTDAANGNGLYLKAGGSNSGKYALAIDNAAASSLLYLDSSGNLGIGTSSPAYRLHVNSGSSTTVAVESSGATSLYRGYSIISGATEYASFKQRFDTGEVALVAGLASWGGFFTFSTNGTERMRLDSSGNLGIGTTNPSAYGLVAVNGASASVNINATTGAAAFKLYEGAGTGRGSVTSLNGANGLAFLYGTTEGMRLDSSGNLGLGVTPSAIGAGRYLQVLSTTSFGQQSNGSANVLCNAYESSGNAFSYVVSAAASRYNASVSGHQWFVSTGVPSAGAAISFTQAMTLDASGNLQLGATSGSGNRLNVVGTGGIRVNEDGASTKVITIRSDFAGVDPSVMVTSNHALLLGTNNTERARITSGGDLLVGTTSQPFGSAVARFAVSYATADYTAVIANSNATTPYGQAIYYSAAAPNNTSALFLYCADNAAQRASIRSNGGLANYSGNDVNLSDRREKTNFAPAKSYLDTICAIPVQTFNYIDQPEDDPGLTLGVVAQDVQAVAPELVMESNWGTEDNPKMRLSIYQTDLQYALMKCVQELKAQNDELRARVQALEAQP